MAKAGAMLDKGCVAGGGMECEELSRSQKKRWIFVDQTSEEMKHRTKWCAEANKCGRGSKYMKMPGKCTGPKYLSEISGNGESVTLEVSIW